MALNEDTMKLEPRALTNAFCTGTKPIFKLRTKLGRTIRATGNHKFRTFEGWRRLDELAVGDALALPCSLAATGPGMVMAMAGVGGRERRVADAVRSPELGKLAESDIYWDPVVSIEAAGAEEVFDLTVDGLHNFVANDIVVHNSIEQDADIVSFIYRDEYYNKESERPGEADLVIAKHRNGPIGTVPLAFQDQFPKFVNLASPQYGGAEDAHGEAA